MRALILSAGLGERLRPLTLKKAKPAVEFLNVPMLGFPYFWLNTLGLTDVVFNTHYLPETVRHAALHVCRPETRVHFSHEPEILGSGGGIWNARFDLMEDRTFAVANGDGVIVHPDNRLFHKMLDHHRHQQALATILVCPLEGVGSKIPGVWMDSHHRVVGFGKTQPAAGTTCYHYASYMFFSDELWPLLPEGNSNILYDVLEPKIREGAKVSAFLVPDLLWFETGNVADYLKATAMCLSHFEKADGYGQNLTEILDQVGPTFRMQSRLDRRQLIADSAQIGNFSSLNGYCVIGENVRIAENAHIKDSVLLSNVTVASGTTAQNEVLIS